MLNLVTIPISLFLIVLTGWTFISYFAKKDSQELITEELSNLFDICKQFVSSIINLIRILASKSIFHDEKETTPIEETVFERDERKFNLVKPIQEIKGQSVEIGNDDDALSLFSPEVVDVINEEEEKVA